MVLSKWETYPVRLVREVGLQKSLQDKTVGFHGQEASRGVVHFLGENPGPAGAEFMGWGLRNWGREVRWAVLFGIGVPDSTTHYRCISQTPL